MRALFVVMCALALLAPDAYGRWVSVFDVDASDFPRMRARFYAVGSDGVLQYPTASELRVRENGRERPILSVDCAASAPVPLSSLLVMDVSRSMSFGTSSNIDAARAGARAWIAALPAGLGECAVSSFDVRNYLDQDYTDQAALLYGALDRLNPAGESTDYDAALLTPLAGALRVTDRGRYKRVIVWLTDGHPRQEPRVDEIVDEATRQGCVIHAVVLGMPAPESVRRIAARTGGEVFDGVVGAQEAVQAYGVLLQRSQHPVACTVEWQSEAACGIPGAAGVELAWGDALAGARYMPPPAASARLELDPPSFRFDAPPIGVPQTATVKVTARGADFTVKDIVPQNTAFTLTPASFSLADGQSIDLTLGYTAADSSYAQCTFALEGDLCMQYMYAAGGHRGKAPRQRSLRLVSPNGGEVLGVGADTVIAWEGVSPRDTVHIDYSPDGGASWQTVSRDATGLRHAWTSVPAPASGNALVRISQGEYDDDYDANSLPLRIGWQRTYGGSHSDWASAIIETADGHYLVVGYTESSDGDVAEKKDSSGAARSTDMWVVKLNRDNGSIVWQKTFGGSGEERAHSVVETADGHYVIAGETSSRDGDVTQNKGSSDYWLLKLRAADGSAVWQRTYGGNGPDAAYSVIEASDGAYVVAGFSWSGSGDVASTKGRSDYWLLKLSPSDGAIIWQKTYGGTGQDWAYSVVQASDGHYVVVGGSDSEDGDVSANAGDWDYWVVKVHPNGGNIVWERSLGGSGEDLAHGILQAADGSYVVVGGSASSDGHITRNRGDWDCWVLSLEPSDGSIRWQNTYGGTGQDRGFSVIQEGPGRYGVVGWTYSSDGEVINHKGAADYWLLSLRASDGALAGAKTFGGGGQDVAYAVIQDSRGHYAMAGYTQSRDGQVTNPRGNSDYWIVRTEGRSILQSDTSDAFFSVVQTPADASDVDMGDCVAGAARDSVVASFVRNTASLPLRVDSVYIRGADAAAFSPVSGRPPYTVAAGAARAAEFRFRPGRIGLHRAELVVITQADTLVRNIRGMGIAREVAVLTDAVDFGKVPTGTSKDVVQVATLRNIGTTPLSVQEVRVVAPGGVFTVTSGGDSFVLQPGQERRLNLRFSPANIGRTTAVVEFHYGGAGSPALLQLFGEGVNNVLALVTDAVDFGRVRVGESSDKQGVVAIRNISNAPVNITGTRHALPNDSDFVTTSGGGSFVLQPGQQHAVNLRFTPSSLGRTSGLLEFAYDGPGSPVSMILLGEGADSTVPSITIAVDVANRAPGDNFLLPVRLADQSNLYLSGLTGVDCDLVFNPTLLRPVGYTVVPVDDTTAKIRLTNLNPLAPVNGRLASVQCVAGLGNAASCELRIENVTTTGRSADVTIENGRLNLVGVCYEGGIRLINPGGTVGLRVWPNPGTGDVVTAQVTLIEKGESVLRLVDHLGKEIYRTELRDAVGTTDLELNIKNIPSGMYFLQLRTPNIERTHNVVIQK